MFLETAQDMKIFLESGLRKHQGGIATYPFGFVLVEHMPVVQFKFEWRLRYLPVVNSYVPVIFAAVF
jgi:hypothetical protein